MDQHDLQNAKELIWNFHQKLDGAQISEIGDIIAAHTDEDYIWRGYHPFNELRGSNEIADLFWAPFRNAVNKLQRRVDIFLAGKNEIDNFKSTWVVSMQVTNPSQMLALPILCNRALLHMTVYYLIYRIPRKEKKLSI